MDLDRESQVEEASLLLRYLIQELKPRERAAVLALALDRSPTLVAEEVGLTVGGLWMAKKVALQKLRKRLHRLGIRSTADLL